MLFIMVVAISGSVVWCYLMDTVGGRHQAGVDIAD